MEKRIRGIGLIRIGLGSAFTMWTTAAPAGPWSSVLWLLGFLSFVTATVLFWRIRDSRRR